MNPFCKNSSLYPLVIKQKKLFVLLLGSEDSITLKVSLMTSAF